MKKKNQMLLSIIGVAILIVAVVGVSFAFFNYTRTGTSNNVRVGRIAFSSTQNSTINLGNVFPIATSQIGTDIGNHDTVTVNITGDTTYGGGIEYKVTIEDVNNTINNKSVPISFEVTANNLGTPSNDYYNDRGSDTNVYNLVERGTATDGELVLVGYIKPDAVGINGSIDITAYIDTNDIAISDTYPRIENNNLVYGETTGEWAAGRVVFTTDEWNSFSSTPLSFKVKVEANEGIWVEEPNSLVLKNLSTIQNWKDIRANITSIEFSTNPEVPNNAITSFDVTDITSTGPVTLYTLDDGLGNNTVKAVICADGEIYAPEDMSEMFFSCTKLITFSSENFKVDNVVNMYRVFCNCPYLSDISSLSTWNTENVENMFGMFINCRGLVNVNPLSNWNTSNVTNMRQMFAMCIGLINVDGLINWNTSSVTDMIQIFRQCRGLTNVNGLINWDTSGLTNMQDMFNDCSSLLNVDGLANWNVSNVTTLWNLFWKCTNLSDISGLANWNVSNVTELYSTFGECRSLSDISALKKWNVSNVESMEYMFSSCPNLTDASIINNWDINSNANFTYMFYQTPDHPEFTKVAGIWTNEGTFVVSNLVPIEYIASSGTQYIDTGVPGNNDNLSFEIKYSWLVLSTNVWQWVFGCNIDNDTNSTRLLQYSTNTTYAGVNTKANGGSITYNGNRTVGTIYEETISQNTYTTNGTPVNLNTIIKGNENPENVYLFSRNGPAGNSSIRLYYFRIYDNGTLIRNYVPYKSSDGSHIGLLDTVNNVFYESMSSTAFIAPEEPNS